jgi:hypothetical protein
MVVLGLILITITYKYVIQGDVMESADGRTAILLERNERDFVLSEMRVFLQSVQQITGGIYENDMELVAEYARKSGRNAQMEVPGSLIGKLPSSFKKMGFDTHAKFDELALDAEQLGDRDHALSQMNRLLGNCVACHAVYRFEVTAGTPM